MSQVKAVALGREEAGGYGIVSGNDRRKIIRSSFRAVEEVRQRLQL